MTLRFPTLDVLRLALTSGAVSAAVRASATRFAFDQEHTLWVEPTLALEETSLQALRRLGVLVSSPGGAPDLIDSAEHWLQMFPLLRDLRADDIGDKTPILFQVTSPEQFGDLVTEILRLGNDRQSFRWLEGVDQGQGLLRVIGPPYYSLLRALEPIGDGTQSPSSSHPIAYREAAPRVWVQVGFRHPLAEHLQPPEGHLLLLRSPHVWQQIPDGRLLDIYEVIDFQLPVAPAVWRESSLLARIGVPMKLSRSGGTDSAELWLLHGDGIAQLEEFVRASDNDLLARLAFAVIETHGARGVVLRVRPSKLAPPMLVLDAVAFRPYLRIPNLFVPVGQSLHPPLRRDAVVKLLASDTARVHWLRPHGNSFQAESLPDDAFRPLSQWVDYILEYDHLAMEAWMRASQFDFEGFICKEESPKDAKPPRDPKPAQPRAKAPESTGPKPKQEPRGSEKKPAREDAVEDAPARDLGEVQRRLREVEQAFSVLPTALDDPHRQELWREMAELNGLLDQHVDAAICWGCAMWEQPTVTVDWPRTWFRLEARHTPGNAPPTSQVLGILKLDMPTHSSLRQLTAYLIWSAAHESQSSKDESDRSRDIRPHLGRMQRFLEQHENLLGVRPVWLAWHSLHKLAGGDVLTLVRARDRLLERLFAHGLTPELDLPGFLRFTGTQASARFREVRDQVVRLRRLVQDWAKIGTNPTPATHAYIDLVFAFGLARLGETSEAVRLRDVAAEELQTGNEVHNWLFQAFAHRIRQALDSKPAVGQFPESMLKELEAITRPEFLQHMPKGQDRLDAEKRQSQLRFRIDRMRDKSRILEPHERIDAFRHYRGAYDDVLTRELASLSELNDRAELTQKLERLLAGKQKFAGASNPPVRILIAALELAPRLGQRFGEEVLDRVPALLTKTREPEDRAKLLENSIFLAAHYDRKEDVQRYVAAFEVMLQGASTLSFEKLIPVVTGSFRSLRKFGMREQVARLMQALADIISVDNSEASRVNRLCVRLELASAWFFFGDESKGRAILDEARELLFRKILVAGHQSTLAAAYVAALGQAPMEFALARLMEFYRKVEGVYDNWTTVEYFSLSRFSVVEATVLALVSDEFTLDRDARKRLDDDEFLVRRRIHRDVRDALAAEG